jgi:hypothetical protein
MPSFTVQCSKRYGLSLGWRMEKGPKWIYRSVRLAGGIWGKVLFKKTIGEVGDNIPRVG